MSTGGAGTPDAARGDPSTSPVGPGRAGLWRNLRIAGLVVVGAQLAVSLALSTFLFHRFHLIEDFGIFNQAWTLIGQGHLNPYNSIYGFPFYKSHFELIMWPLALTHLVYAQPVVLLWFQAVTAGAAELVVFFWILEHLERREVPRGVVLPIGCAVLAVILVNPLLWSTVSFDFHFESTATLFAVLAVRALYRGRFATAWVWIAMTLLCGDVAALYVVGIGLSALVAGPTTRRHGLLAIAAGGAWLAMISAIGANLGSSVNDYAYLAARATLPAGGGLALVVVGALTHPSRVFHVVTPRLHFLWDAIEPAGVIGLASAWGFGVPMVVLVSSVLNSSNVYITSPFQNFAVFPFLLFGTVSVLVWLAVRLRSQWTIPAVVAAVLLLVAVVTGVNSARAIVQTAVDSGPTASQAAVLRSVLQQTPGDAEVAVSLRVVGRFSSRQLVYVIEPSTQAIPVSSRDLVVVLAVTSGIDATPSDRAGAVLGSLTHAGLPVRVLAHSDGIYAVRVSVPQGIPQIDLPGAVP